MCQSILLWLLLVTLVAGISEEHQYCAIRYRRLCQGKGRHIACQYPDSGPGASCERYTQIRFTNELKHFITHYLNRRRQRIAVGNERVRGGVHLPKPQIMMLVEWDRELALLAQRLADQCHFVHDDCRATVKFPYAGQTVGEVRWRRSSDSDELSAQRAIRRVLDAWWGERRRVQPKQLTAPFRLTAKGTVWGHFSQLAVWNLQAVGCGAVRHGARHPRLLLVCDFSHTNMLGQRTLVPGALAPCPMHTARRPRTAYPALCGPNGTPEDWSIERITPFKDYEDQYEEFVKTLPVHLVYNNGYHKRVRLPSPQDPEETEREENYEDEEEPEDIETSTPADLSPYSMDFSPASGIGRGLFFLLGFFTVSFATFLATLVSYKYASYARRKASIQYNNVIEEHMTTPTVWHKKTKSIKTTPARESRTTLRTVSPAYSIREFPEETRKQDTETFRKSPVKFTESLTSATVPKKESSRDMVDRERDKAKEEKSRKKAMFKQDPNFDNMEDSEWPSKKKYFEVPEAESQWRHGEKMSNTERELEQVIPLTVPPPTSKTKEPKIEEAFRPTVREETTEVTETELLFRPRWKQTRIRPQRPGVHAILYATTVKPTKKPAIASISLDKEDIDQLFRDTGFNLHWRKPSQ